MDRTTKLRGYGRMLLLLLLLSGYRGFSQYRLNIQPVDKDSLFVRGKLLIPATFRNRAACSEYISTLPATLQVKGYMTASVDSVGYDSAGATIRLYIGPVYRWAHISTRKIDPALLSAVGWNERSFSGRPLDFGAFRKRQEALLDYLENNGYPFAKIGLDSIAIDEQDRISADLKVDKGLLYKIDSIRVYGTVKLSGDFLQHYLNIPNGSIYRKDRLAAISKKIIELPYVQEQQSWNLTMLGDGAVVNLYLKPKKSSQINVLVGFLPSSDPVLGNKILITGEATIDLKNALGSGETIALNWQQLQAQSPRLNILFQQPYLFKSPFGLNASFDLYKQDSSYINVDLMLGAQYALSATQSGTVFLRDMITNVLNIDTQSVISNHALPTEADISSVSLGMTYEFNNTNYRFNPRKGNELQFIGSAGTKTIHKNAQIQKLSDPSDPGFDFNTLYDTVKLSSYQFQVRLAGAHYFPVSGASTLKLGFNGGAYSSPTTYRNELFLIGGYKLLRGFDEASILAAQYAVGTMEYRYLIGLNSFLFTFIDGGWARNRVPGYELNNAYFGMGLGLAFETKAGIFNISYAVGKRDDTNLNLRDAKIHLGYVSFF
ncbi:MAG: BamA/TamA family outer membrane protein [Bacteroidota bacterium]|nr:BamA/TamA family outer membrane protein [Bacteroidota bacterium]MDP4257975.1 BamA/TamA family outer membrane protein [Bacteroidota bacterium]